MADRQPPDAVRLQKYLSQAGVASRREAERLMLALRVTVDGKTVSELGARVVPGEVEIRLDGVVVGEEADRWIAYHKSPGVLTTRSDPHGGRTIYDELPDGCGGLRYVGRLDRDAEGLILLTNQGDVAHELQHPSSEVEREYRIEVAGRVTRDTTGRLLRGVHLDDGPAQARRIQRVQPGEVTSKLTLVLTEGRKREVRRLMSAVGHPVIRLSRERFGPIALGTLARGSYRKLSGKEISQLKRAAGML